MLSNTINPRTARAYRERSRNAIASGIRPNVGSRKYACNYPQCSASSRFRHFKSDALLLKHHQTYHSEELQRYAEERAKEAARRNAHGGMRAITKSAMEDFGMENEESVSAGRRIMSTFTRNNQSNFLPLPSYDPMPTTTAIPTDMLMDKGGSGAPESFDPEGETEATISSARVDHGEYTVDTNKTQYHPTGGARKGEVEDSKRVLAGSMPFAPFDNAHDFKMGAWFLRGNATTETMRSGFNSGLLQLSDAGLRTSITSAKTVRNKMDKLEPDFGEASWKCGTARFYAEKNKEEIEFHYRDPRLIIKHLLKQPAYRDYLSYTPVRHYNARNRRIYSEICSGDWWWKEQEALPENDGTVVPLLFTSDQTKLTTHVGNQMFWPLFMTIGNIHSTIRAQPSSNAWVLLAQLPVPPPQKKFHALKDSSLDENGFTKTDSYTLYTRHKEDAFGAVIEAIFKPLANLARSGKGLLAACADGFYRTVFPRTAAWLADFQEYNKLYATFANGCCLCEVSTDQLGDNCVATPRNSEDHLRAVQLFRYIDETVRILDKANKDIDYRRRLIREDPTFPRTKTLLEKMLTEKKAQWKLADVYFTVRQSKPIDNALWKTGVMKIQDVWKPDLLHTIYEGMVPHILGPLKGFLLKHNRLARFEEAWMRLPSFNSIPAPKRSIFESEQRTGKALRDTLRQLLPVLVIALENPKASEESVFHDCLAACRYLVDFSLISTYRFHTSTSLGYMQSYLDGFHRYKHVFKEHRPEPTANNAQKKQKQFKVGVAEEDLDKPFVPLTSEEEGMVADQAKRAKAKSGEAAKAKQRVFSALQVKAKRLFENGDKAKLQEWLEMADDIEGYDFEECVPLLEQIATDAEKRHLDDDAYWKIPKLHLLCHFRETIQNFGYLQQFSTEIGETLHKGIKEAFRYSSKGNHVPQILQYHTRKFALRMREMNLLQLARDGRFEQQIQKALGLFGRRKDRLLSQKLYREGLGSIHDSEYYEAELESGLGEVDDLMERQQNLVPTDAEWYCPSALPLFAGKEQLVMGRELRRMVQTTSSSTCTVRKIMEVYELSKLDKALKHYLVHELDFPSDIALTDIQDFRANAFQQLAITAPSFQSLDPYEVQKCFCTGIKKAPWRQTPRNDTIMFVDNDEYSALMEKDHNLQSDFGDYRFGTLNCLLRLRIPKEDHIQEFMATKRAEESKLRTVELALVEGYQPVRFSSHGEMIPGALLGRCAMPKIVQGLKQSVRENLAMGTHNVQRRNGGRIMGIESILRAVHLVPCHDTETAMSDEKKSWVVNNRSDLGTWDILYSRETEAEENRNFYSDLTRDTATMCGDGELSSDMEQ